MNASLQQIAHAIGWEKSSHRSLHANPSLRLYFACPGICPVSRHMFFQEDAKVFFGVQVVEKIMRHKGSGDSCIDAIGRAMSQSCLNGTTLDYQGKGWIKSLYLGASDVPRITHAASHSQVSSSEIVR